MITAFDSQTSQDFLGQLVSRNLWDAISPLKLHLGCGEQHFAGYVNVDYPPQDHNVMSVKADIYADVIGMQLPNSSVEEIRLHHVFEHFSRVTALAMLVKWHSWLKLGGKLHIETPDLLGSAHNLINYQQWNIKMGTVRHLAGDQAAAWAYHVDHWFPERYERTLKAFGFDQVQTRQFSWPHEPYLCNVEAIAIKTRQLDSAELLLIADKLLLESTVAEAERPTFEVWRQQLRQVLAGASSPKAGNVTKLDMAANCNIAASFPDAAQLPMSRLSLNEIYDFNQLARDVWVRNKARLLPAGTRVLDVGAGTCPYKDLFNHCEYKTHDFKQYQGEKLGGTTAYGQIDYVSDILSIPVPDNSFDIILCTEVFEHIPEPIAAFKELARIVKPNGKIWITAPLGSGLHQEPFHFYGGYTPHWYRHFSEKFGLSVSEITPNGGFFKHLAQECARAANYIGESSLRTSSKVQELRNYLLEILPRVFFEFDQHAYHPGFTVGYFVEAIKGKLSESAITSNDQTSSDPTLMALLAAIERDPHRVDVYVEAALHLVELKQFRQAKQYTELALKLVPEHPQLIRLLRELEALS